MSLPSEKTLLIYLAVAVVIITALVVFVIPSWERAGMLPSRQDTGSPVSFER